MEFQGTVFKVLPQVSGTSQRGAWSKQEVVFELQGDFNRKACVSFWGDLVGQAASLRPGEQVKVAFDIDSREYNGRWYTDIRAWKLTKAQEAPGPVPVDEVPFGSETGSDSDQVPF